MIAWLKRVVRWCDHAPVVEPDGEKVYWVFGLWVRLCFYRRYCTKCGEDV